MLLTRAPLRPKPSFDLHVLSLPPAFVLSQDQTLKLTSMAEPWNGARPKHYITLARCSDFGRPGIPVRRRLRIPSCLFTCQTAGNRFRSPSRSVAGPAAAGGRFLLGPAGRVNIFFRFVGAAFRLHQPPRMAPLQRGAVSTPDPTPCQPLFSPPVRPGDSGLLEALSAFEPTGPSRRGALSRPSNPCRQPLSAKK